MECGGLTATTAVAVTTTTLDDLFSSQPTEVDVGMEWLSIFVEDCLSSKGSCLPPPTAVAATTASDPAMKPQNSAPSLHSFAVAGKARSKRKRIAAAVANSKTPLAPSQWAFPSPDPPLLDQAYWLADSELIAPKKPALAAAEEEDGADEEGENKGVKGSMGISQQQPRRCTHCLSQRTPQWRAGPLGPKTLCNACGVRYKSGRLLPEYRPAKSPTFISCLHSNSHKKVLEMRSGVGTGVGVGTGRVPSSDDDDDSRLLSFSSVKPPC